METIIGAGGPGGLDEDQPSDLIKDGNTAGFAADVIEASMQRPVIVDFWAPWCGPCKTLGPAIEKAVREARGAVSLVKIDIDQNQDLAAQMRVQSIPAVFAFFQGRPVDGFVGAQPESQITAFVKRLAEAAGTARGPSPVEQALEEANAALEAGQHGAASALFGQILQAEPDNTVAAAGLIRCRLASGDVAGAKAMFEGLDETIRKQQAFDSIAASLDLAEAGAGAGSIDDLRAQLAQNANNHQARFDLAMALFSADQREAAVDELLEVMRRDRNWDEEAARKQLLKFFDAWGPTDPLTVESRRRLSSLLFS